MSDTYPKLKQVNQEASGGSAMKENVLAESSELKGPGGWVESALRRFRNLGVLLLLLPVTAVCTSAIGISLTPAIFLVKFVFHLSQNWNVALHYYLVGTSIALGFVIYGITLIFVVPLFNFLMPFRVVAFRGIWYSLPAIPWYVHNAFTYIVRYTFLEFVTPSPANLLFYRMMGMKIGKGVVINSTNISDPCMIELGDYVTIGGSAHLMAHYGQKGYLVISPVKIGKGTTIGLKASVMGGVTIGQDCNIKPHAAVLPKTEVPDKSVVD